MSRSKAAVARQHMVDSQLRPNRVNDERIVAAMGVLPREMFVDPALVGVAYIDEDIAIGRGRHLMEPRVFALLLQAADIAPDDVALDIGCASGYSAAVLARLAGTVVGLESDRELAQRASSLLAELGADNVAVVEGPLDRGLADQAPFDVIVLEGAVDEAPAALLDQLAEGGRLVAVIRENAVGRATLWRRSGGLTARRQLFDAATPLLPGFARAPGFVF